MNDHFDLTLYREAMADCGCTEWCEGWGCADIRSLVEEIERLREMLGKKEEVTP